MRFDRNIILAGKVYNVRYFMIYGKHRRIFNFVGLCINNNKNNKTFTLQNYYGKEFIKINFPIYSPNILEVHNLKNYNFKFRLNKLYYFKKSYYSSKNQPMYGRKNFIKKENLNFIYEAKKITLKKKKQLRDKFRL